MDINQRQANNSHGPMNFKSAWSMLRRRDTRAPDRSTGEKSRGEVIYVTDDPPHVSVDLIYAVLRSARGYRSLVWLNIGCVDGLPAAWFIGQPTLLKPAETLPCSDHRIDRRMSSRKDSARFSRHRNTDHGEMSTKSTNFWRIESNDVTLQARCASIVISRESIIIFFR